MNKLNILTIFFIFFISLATAEAYYVSISPNPANTANTLTCNTDTPNPYFFWYDTNNLGSVIGTASTFPDWQTTRGQTYRCIVKRYVGGQGLVVVGQDDRAISNAPPQIILFNLMNGTVGAQLNFTSLAIDVIDNDAITYAWTFGDGGISALQNPGHIYSAANNYTVTLTVNDGNGGTDSRNGIVSVNATTVPPAAINYTINLSSVQNNNQTQNLPTLAFNFTIYTLPNSTSGPAAIYNISYVPSLGFVFVNWTATPFLIVANPFLANTSVNVTGNGSLTAVYADVQPPAITIWSPQNITYVVPTVLINITAADNVAVSQIWYSIDNAANITYTVPVNSSALVNGAHNLTAYANDTSNNLNSTSVSFTIAVPPTLYNVTLDSQENNSLTFNQGTTSFNLVTYTLSNSTLVVSGTYNLSFNTPSGLNFSYWNATPNILVGNVSAISTNATVLGNGTITAVYYNSSVAPPAALYNVTLNSQENNSATFNNGTITLNNTIYGLANSTLLPAGTYNLSYSPSTGYNFSYWNSTPNIVIGNISAISTNATVIGNGTITAVYYNNSATVPPNPAINYTINLTSQQNNLSTANLGQMIFNVTAYNLSSLILAANGTYPLVYIPDVNYTFDHWNTTGLVAVGNQFAVSTNATVSGNGTIIAVYNYTGITNLAPNVTLLVPPNITFFTSNNVSLQFNVIDDLTASLPNCDLYLNNVLNQTIGPVANNTSPIFNLTNLANGNYNWSVRCSDGSLIGYSQNWTFSVNTSAPVVNYTINLFSQENISSVNTNLGTIDFNFITYNLSNQTLAPTGTYAINFNAPAGLNFSYWNATPGLVVTLPTAQSTTVFVSGNGNLTAVYYNSSAPGTGGVHDINISETYINSVNGIRITNSTGTDITVANLTLGDTFTVRYRTDNVGTFTENFDDIINIYDQSGAMIFTNTHTHAARAPGSQTTDTDTWITSGLSAGQYNITVNASLTGFSDANPLDNYKVRIVNLVNTSVPVGGTNAVPVVTLLAPLNGAVLNDTQNIQFNYTFTDDNLTASCSIYLDGILNQNNPSVTNNTLASFTITGIPFGSHLWNISCSDGTNTAWSAVWTFSNVNTSVADTLPPVITFIAPTPANNSVINQSYFFVNTSIIDNVAVSNALLEFNGFINFTMSGAGSNWYMNVTGLPIGTYAYKVYAVDPSGNWGASGMRFVTINQSTAVNNDPVVILNLPANNTQFSNTQNITFSYTVTDDTATTLQCSYYIDSVYVGLNSSVQNGTLTSFTRNVSYGSHDWFVFCTDGIGGNLSQIWYFNVTDTIAPNLTIISPISTTYSVNNILVNISATDVNLDKVWYNINNGANISYTVPVLSAFADGSYTLTAFANDTFGNLATASVSFIVNTSGTVRGFVYDSDNRIWNATVQLKQGSATIAQTYTDVDGNYSVTVPAGNYNISVLKSGFNPANVGTIITTGGTTTQNVLLTAASGSGAITGGVYDFPGFSIIPNATVYVKISGTNTIVQIVKSKAAGTYGTDNYRINGLVSTNSYDLWANMPPTYLNSYLNQTGVFVPSGGTATAKDLVIS